MAEAMLFFRFYSFFLVISIGTFLAGYILLNALCILHRLPDFFAKLFFSMLTGSILVVFFISIAATKGKTISIAFIPLFIGLYLEYRKSGMRPGFPKYFFRTKLNLFNCIWILVGNLVAFLFFFLLFYRNDAGHFIMPSKDFPYYGSVSYNILHTGQENYFQVLTTYSPEYAGVTPYHYFELWFDAAWASALHINFAQCLFFLIYPFFAFCYYTGIISILCLLVGNQANRYFIFPFIALFTAGICFTFYNKIPFLHTINLNAIIIHPLFFAEPKISILACFFSAFFILYFSGHSRISFILLFFLPVCSITVMPSVLGGFMLFYIFSWWFGFLDVKKHFSTFLVCIVEILCIVSFYFLLSVPDTSKSSINFHTVILRSFFVTSFLDLKNVIGLFIAYLMITIVLYLPFMVINLKSLLQNLFLRNLFFLFLSINFCGLIVAALSFAQENNNQLYELSSFAFINLLTLCMGVWQLHNEKSILRKAGTVTIIILAAALALNQEAVFYPIFIAKPSYKYIVGINNFVKKYDLQRGVSITNLSKDLENPLPVTTYVGGMYMPFYSKEGLMPVSISDFGYRIDSQNVFNRNRDMQLLQVGIFYRFVQEQKKAHSFKSIDESQLNFINKYKVNFAIVSKNSSLSPLLQKRVISVIRDPVTGDRFVVLKKSN